MREAAVRTIITTEEFQSKHDYQICVLKLVTLGQYKEQIEEGRRVVGDQISITQY